MPRKRTTMFRYMSGLFILTLTAFLFGNVGTVVAQHIEFGNPVNYSAITANADTTITGDFNADGEIDVAWGSTDGVYTAHGNGDGTFRFAVKYLAGSSVGSLVAGDFNGDGISDLAAASSGRVSVLHGNGDGTFQLEIDTPVDGNTRVLAAGNFNAGSRLNLIAVDVNNRVVSVLPGEGGFFQIDSGNNNLNQFPRSVAVGDFNKDGNSDVALANVDESGVSVLLGNGDGTFQPALNVGFLSLIPDRIKSADLNRDGVSDLVLISSSERGGTCSGTVALLGNGDGTFREVSVACGVTRTGALSVAVDDFNGDGNPDLSIVNSGSDGNELTVLPGDGNGAFRSEFKLAFDNPKEVSTADFNGDGKPDILVATSHGFAVLLNLTNGSPVVIGGQIITDGGSPLSGVSVTLSGSQSASAVTDGNGQYSFPNVERGGNYVVAPAASNLYKFDPPSHTFNNLSESRVANFTATPYSLRGRVTDLNDVGIAAVTITVTVRGESQTRTFTTETDVNGNYQIADLPGGCGITVAPSKQGFMFSPQSTGSVSSRCDVVFRDRVINFFGATRAYTISGRIIDAAGNGVSGAQLTLTATRQAFTFPLTTDGSGNFFAGEFLAGDNYTLMLGDIFTPSGERRLFSPPGRTFNNLSSNQIVIFEENVRISGQVTDGSTALTGGQITFSYTVSRDGFMTAGSGTANLVLGNTYTVILPPGSTGIISASQANYSFNPPGLRFENLRANMTLNFMGTPATTYNIAGRVLDGQGNGIAFLPVTLSGSQLREVRTDSSGRYTIANVPATGTYTVRPGQPLTFGGRPTVTYSFKLNTRTFTNLSGNQNADFVAAPFRSPRFSRTRK